MECAKDIEGNGAAAPQRRHPFWEEDLFPGEEPHCYTRLKYHGLRLSLRRDGAPLLLAEVEGEDASGAQFIWIARRCRKRVLQPHQCSRPPPRVAWLRSLNPRTEAAKLGWWVGLTFAVGSLLFLVSGVSRLIKSVARPDAYPPGLSSVTALLTAWPEAVACDIFFTAGCLLAVVEAMNMDWKCRLHAWEKGGRQGGRPRQRWLPTLEALRTVSFWATAIQLAGIMGFNVATTLDVVGSKVALGEEVVRWGMKFTFTFGGGAFTVGSLLGCWEETGNWWRGLVPTRLSDLQSISWFTVFFNFYGSVGFLLNGALLFKFDSFSWLEWQWVIGTCHFAASAFFLLASLLAMVEQANPGHL